MKKRLLPLLLVCLLLAACGERAPDLALAQTDLSTITVPETVQVVGLGEASHGVQEYQELKGTVFQALVENNGCRSFIIEGDFGSALAVDEYIHGGEGTAQEAAAQIGFRIYRTQEMEDILTWMRRYNETAPEGKDLHFYGMDIQWADASKDYLFRVLDRVPPVLREDVQGFRERLELLNDDDMFDLTDQELGQARKALEDMAHWMEEVQEEIVAAVGEEKFAVAEECANSLFACCIVRGSSGLMEYNEIRDRYMAWKVQWYLYHGDGSLLFINGHNGHIAKGGMTSYSSLGKHLGEDLGAEVYFAIGTDARVTNYNSQTDDGNFLEDTVENENALNSLRIESAANSELTVLRNTEHKGPSPSAVYYVDFAAAGKDPGWASLLSQPLSITSLNVGGPTTIKAMYTTQIVPKDSFDGMIVFDTVSPTTLKLDE